MSTTTAPVTVTHVRDFTIEQIRGVEVGARTIIVVNLAVEFAGEEFGVEVEQVVGSTVPHFTLIHAGRRVSTGGRLEHLGTALLRETDCRARATAVRITNEVTAAVAQAVEGHTICGPRF